MNGTDDRNDLKTDGNHVNRRFGVHPNAQLVYEHRVDLKIDPECYAPRDLMMDATLDVMNHHVMLTVCLNTSCDRMNHDHLRYGHRMMRHRDTSRMDGKNQDGKIPDGKLKNSGAKNSGAKMI
jgi:hypothetical protein